MGKIIGYARISSKSQKDNNSLEQQKKEIVDKYNGAIMFEEQFTGTTTDRPIFKKVINELESGDMLIVCKLDRLARNTVEGIETVQALFNKGVSVHVLNIGLLENTSMGKFFLTTLLAVAEMERNSIIERTQNGKAIARLNPNYKEGRHPKFKKQQIEDALNKLAINGGEWSYKRVEREYNISKSTLIREVRKRKFKKDLF